LIPCLLALAAPTFAAELPEVAPPVTTPKPADPHETAIVASLVLAVTQKDATADALVAKARAHGGWFQARDPESVSLRLPVDQAEDLLTFAATQGKVLDRSFSRQDLSQELTDLRGRLEARQSVLKEYDSVLSHATSQSIVSVQSAILQVIGQMEAYQGRIKLLEDQGNYARVDISFQFLDRSAPARDGSSSFRWLNTLNVQDVMTGMLMSRPDWKSGGVTVPTPDGFSAWKKQSRARAASPDGALFRVRVEKHKPKADLPFWREAVRERMVAAGYKLVAESEFEANGAKGGLIELLAPVGTEDWTYVIAFFPEGGKVVIAEAAAEVTTFDAHREAILAAMKALAP
jgi:hypothetical protein